MNAHGPKQRSTVLIVEDDRELQEALKETLVLAKLTVLTADSGEAALQMLDSSTVDLVVSDINMPGMSGIDLLRKLRASMPELPVVLMTAYGSIQDSVTAMQCGASDYLVKPFAAALLLETIAKYVCDGRRANSGGEPIAVAACTRKLFDLASRVAISDASVLISGESGTGKEVLARFIHNKSPRAEGAFVAINCAAIPENMLEAMLFGYEKGAYTGAHAASAGKFEQANGGTILLDEVSEMDLGLQAKLLRVLQEREVERLGSRKPVKLDVRVIATTNRDIKQSIADGDFREDLFYRLSVFPLTWKPLRERRQDIPPLASALLANHARKSGKRPPVLSPAALESLCVHSWPGNVRELDNVMQRCLILNTGDQIVPDDLALDSNLAGVSIDSDKSGDTSLTLQANAKGVDGLSDLDSDLRKKEYEIIVNTLIENRGKRNLTAQLLGISARTLRYKMARIRESGVDIDSMIGI